MTWWKAKDLSHGEAVALVQQILYAAVDGMDGVDFDKFILFIPNENKTIVKYGGYWHGCVETAARTLAFVFAGSWVSDYEGIPIGETVDAILPGLDRAVLQLAEKCKTGVCDKCHQKLKLDRAVLQENINAVERFVDDAAAAFFEFISPVPLRSQILKEIERQQSEREVSRAKVASG